MTSHRRSLTTVAVAGSLLLAACSSNSTPHAAHPGTPTPPATHASAGAPATSTASGVSADPCSLLTQAEVDAAAGQPLGQGGRVGALDGCQWSTSDFAGSVELDVSDWSSLKTKSAQTGQPLTPVSGVGDEAMGLNLAGNSAQLYVRKGSTGFLILLGGAQYIGSLPDLGLTQEKTLAAAVLGRL
jgi:hypothetical protein